MKQVATTGKQSTQLERRRDDPLSYRFVGKHVLQQVRGGVLHLPRAAAGTDARLTRAAIREKDAKQIAADVKQPAAEDGPRARTIAAWDALDLETRYDILDDYGPKYDHYVTSGEVSLSDLEGPRRAFAEKMVDSLLDHVGECEDGHYGLVGDPNTTIEVVELPTGEIVGGRVYLFQQGFDPEEEGVEIDEDEMSYHYDSAEACAAAGFDPDQDISWGVSGLFNHDGKPLDEGRMDTYWEWSGW